MTDFDSNKYQNRQTIVLAFIMLILIAGCLLLWFILTSLPFSLNRNDLGSVASMFTLTLMQNQEKKAKSLVDPELWPQIESWMDEHEAVKCSWPSLDSSVGYGVGSENDQFANYSYTITLPCPDFANYYCISVDDMALQKTEKGWKIIETGTIEEFFGDFMDSDC